jgi:hypothetical protein
MPIIEPLPNPQAPLSQGDILKGVCLCFTKRVWKGGGGEPGKLDGNSLCLVLSRPCVALRDEYLVVAAIEKYKTSPPGKFDSYEEAKEFFNEIRDGLKTPDQFYLGQIAGYEGKFCARFDSLHTIQIPKDSTEDRRTFIAASRIGRLHQDFAHDLHLRLFRAFASLGFDDHRWFPDDDLRALVAVADRDESQKKTALLDARAKLELGNAQGFPHESVKARCEADQAKCEKDLQKLIDEITPYRKELERRSQSGEAASQ